jgi:hypothetical protein
MFGVHFGTTPSGGSVIQRNAHQHLPMFVAPERSAVTAISNGRSHVGCVFVRQQQQQATGRTSSEMRHGQQIHLRTSHVCGGIKEFGLMSESSSLLIFRMIESEESRLD